MNKTALRNKADRMWSEIVRRRGYCQAMGWNDIACNGSLQAMHIVPRRYLSVRWDPSNGLAGCGAHHTYFTHHPLEWEVYLLNQIGSAQLDLLKKRGREGYGPPDYPAVIANLQAILDEYERVLEAQVEGA